MKRFCGYCGAENKDEARFCESCGREMNPAALQQTTNSTGFSPDADGNYHWYYELSLWKNPTIFITCWKIFTFIVLGMALLVFFLLLGEDGFTAAATVFVKFAAGGVGLMTGLLGLGYAVYAAMQGGSYCVVFEMDDKSVTHTQLAKQFKKAQVLAALTALAGAARGSLSMMGTGLLTGSRDSMTTKFEKVDSVKAVRRRNVIYLHAGFGWNQIYVQPELFDAVLAYILAHIPQTAKLKGV